MAHIGTSGWHYPHWRGPFYPADLPGGQRLAYYLRFFDTVELNNTFYRQPTPAAVTAWRAAAPPGFLFSAKGSRFLTHMKKLKATPLGVRRFFSRVDALGRKLGPIVFQLPPRWALNAARLEEFLESLPPRHRYSFELRDPSWHVEEVYRILRRYRAAFCIYEIAGFASPLVVTTDLVYVRLHGPGPGPYQGSYSAEALREWARRIREWEAQGRRVYVYFDNDQAGHAARNALELKRLDTER
jgi:uncharacterized protein YecE (DUF72 family)